MDGITCQHLLERRTAPTVPCCSALTASDWLTYRYIPFPRHCLAPGPANQEDFQPGLSEKRHSSQCHPAPAIEDGFS